MTFRLFLTSDIHGSNKCYRKFLNAAKFYEAQVIVLCGDITGKALVFLVRKPDGSYWANYLGNEYVLKDEREMLELRGRIDDSGYYTYICEEEEFERLNPDRGKQDALLTNCIYERMKEWIPLANSRLADSGTEVYILPGNDDPFIIDGAFENSRIAINPEGRVLTIKDGHEMISTGYVNMTPWRAPRDIEEDELMKRLTAMANQVTDPSRAIFTLHPPPYETNLDLAPALDATLKPKTVLGQVEFEHVGSKSVRKIIEDYQPLLGLHGHVHESKAVHKIGRTMCLNAGSEYESGILKGALVTISRDKIENHAFTSG